MAIKYEVGKASYHRVTGFSGTIDGTVQIRLQAWIDKESRFNGDPPLFEGEVNAPMTEKLTGLWMEAISETLKDGPWAGAEDIIEDPEGNKVNVGNYFNPYFYYQTEEEKNADPVGAIEADQTELGTDEGSANGGESPEIENGPTED